MSSDRSPRPSRFDQPAIGLQVKRNGVWVDAISDPKGLAEARAAVEADNARARAERANS